MQSAAIYGPTPYIQSGASAVYRSMQAKAREIVSVLDFGAVGDGSHDDTVAIQATIDAVITVGGGIVWLPWGHYKCGALTVADATDLLILGTGIIQLTGSGTAPLSYIGIKLSGTCTHVRIKGVHVLGDGVDTHAHAGVWTDVNSVLTDVCVEDGYFDSLSVGVQIGSSSSNGAIVGFRVSNNYIVNPVGTASGSGYGIVNSGGTHGKIYGNTIVNPSGRHDIYQAAGSHVEIFGNTTKNHRASVATGADLPSICIARSQHIQCHHNILDTPYDGGISAVPDASAGQDLTDVSIHDNDLINPNVPYAIWIGADDPSVTQETHDVVVADNNVYLTGVAAGGIALIRVRSGFQVTVRGNQLFAPSNAHEVDFIEIACQGESGASATYNGKLVVHNNTMDGSGSGPLSLVLLATKAAQSIVTIDFRDNLAQVGNSFNLPSTASNPNITIGSQLTDGLTMSVGALALEYRGLRIKGDSYNYAELLTIQNTSASGHLWRVGEQYAEGRLSFRDLTASGAPEVLRLDAVPGTDSVGLLVRCNVGGVYSIQQVTLGAVDSGGSGYKALRVPN